MEKEPKDDCEEAHGDDDDEAKETHNDTDLFPGLGGGGGVVWGRRWTVQVEAGKL